MPTTYNGCGTTYYFSRNRQSYTGTCAACRRVATLSSYDTTLCLVIVFVPVLPLGKKRIIDDCSACRRHSVMKHSEWLLASARVRETLTAYRANPSDPGLAKEALLATVGLRDLNAFLALSPDIQQHLAASAETLLLLAEADFIFGQHELVEGILRAAARVDATKAADEALAHHLIQLGRPDDAVPHLQHILIEGIPDRVDLVYLLAQGYQAKGQHDKALTAFDDCEAINPAIATDATFQKLRATSQKFLGSSKVVPLGAVTRSASRARSFRKFLVGTAAVAAAAAVIYFGAAVFLGFSHEVYLVNGLASAYTVRVGGDEHRMLPGTAKAIRVAEGDLRVEIVDAPPGITPAVIPFRTGFLTRPINSAVFVINPDEAAIVERRRAYYGTNSLGIPADPERLIVIGRPFAEIEAVDFAFEPLPSSIKTKDGASAHRDGVALLSKVPGLSDADLILSLAEDDKAGAAHAAARRVLLEPGRDEILPVAAALMPPADLAALLEPGLATRPLRLQWHRAYQTAMSKLGREAEVEKRYQEFLAAGPRTSELLYLAGRCAQDHHRAIYLFREAAALPSPCGYADYALSLYLLDAGDPQAAADHAERALATNREDPTFRWATRNAALAAERWPRAIELAAAEPGRSVPAQLAAISDEAYAHVRQGSLTRARDAVNRGAALLKSLQGPDQIQAWRAREMAAIEYARGEPSALASHAQSSDQPSDKFVFHLLSGDPKAAQADLASIPDHQAHADLLLCLAASVRDAHEISRSALDAAIVKLSKGNADERRCAALFSMAGTVPLEKLDGISLEPGLKVLVGAALAISDPAGRDSPAAALARKINYARRFPYTVIRDALAALPSKAPNR